MMASGAILLPGIVQSGGRADMPLDYERLRNLAPMETMHQVTRRDTILYALGVGIGAEHPTDPNELQYLYEEGLKLLPTMAVVIAYPGFWAKDPKYGLTWRKLLHGEQSIEIHAPLPVEGLFRGITTIDEIYDKGREKGALLLSSRRIYLEPHGEHVATVRQSVFLRADGGFGGRPDGAPKPHPMPEEAPQLTVRTRSPANQALIYRLSGDSNPLHLDPAVAAEAGFDRPILHGLATYGLVGRALVKALCEDRPERLRRMDVRVTAPLFPGETLGGGNWRPGDGSAALSAPHPRRGLVARPNG